MDSGQQTDKPQKSNTSNQQSDLPETIIPPEASTTPAKKKMSTRRKIIIPVVAVLFLYFSGILGFGYYWVKCGNPPAVREFYFGGYDYVGDWGYAFEMPLTSIGMLSYSCTDKSPLPWVRANEEAASKKQQAASQEAAKQATFNNITFGLYEVKNGTVPNIKKSSQIQLSSVNGGRIAEKYIDTQNHKEFRVIQRKKTVTVADNNICAITVRNQAKDPNYDRQNNFCGESTPKGLRVYSPNLLPYDTKDEPDYVVDIGDTQILVDSDAFRIPGPGTQNGMTYDVVDKAKLYAFIDQLSPVSAQDMKKLYNQVDFY